jgi:hypothetical protein
LGYLLLKILITVWYIWKARNDRRLARKNWTPWWGHHAVAAHISVANLVANAGDQQTGHTVVKKKQAGHTQPSKSQEEGAVSATDQLRLQEQQHNVTGRVGIAADFSGFYSLDNADAEHTHTIQSVILKKKPFSQTGYQVINTAYGSGTDHNAGAAHSDRYKHRKCRYTYTDEPKEPHIATSGLHIYAI